jgi:peptide/nickel transport system permease protein
VTVKLGCPAVFGSAIVPGMVRFIALRLGQALLTLLVSSFIVFALVRTSGNPADLILPAETSPAERQAFIARMGFDRPIPYQYWAFLRSALGGDWGRSLRTGKPAIELVEERFWNSIKLATAALAVTLAIGFPLGVLAAARRGGLWDRLGLGFVVLG